MICKLLSNMKNFENIENFKRKIHFFLMGHTLFLCLCERVYLCMYVLRFIYNDLRLYIRIYVYYCDILYIYVYIHKISQ